jgi:DNA-binding HxlR family transcriptional regulator
MRDIYLGLNRFELMRADLGLPRQTLTNRLEVLHERGIVKRVAYQQGPERFEYVLTESGKELAVALMTLMAWGDRWQSGTDGPPVRLTHLSCGHEIDVIVACDQCGEAVNADEISAGLGPGARVGFGTELVGSFVSPASEPHE